MVQNIMAKVIITCSPENVGQTKFYFFLTPESVVFLLQWYDLFRFFKIFSFFLNFCLHVVLYCLKGERLMPEKNHFCFTKESCDL